MFGNKSLRRELDAASTIIFPSAYLAKLDELKKRFQHSIRVLPEAASIPANNARRSFARM
jgi:hypothetical protein